MIPQPANPYDAYRDLLAMLADDAPILDAIKTAGAQQGWWSQLREWQRIYNRFHLGEEPLVTLLFETIDSPQDICTVDLFEERPTVVDGAQVCMPISVFGWLRLTRFPYESKLMGLTNVLESVDSYKVLRYRPHKRCTIRVGREGTDEVRFAKVFADDRGGEIHLDSQKLWRASEAGEFDFAVARPLTWDEETQTLWQEPVSGTPIVERLFSSKGPLLAERIGRAAASITSSTIQPSKQSGAKKQLKRSMKCAKRLRRLFPDCGPQLDYLLERLTALHKTTDASRLRPIHGAPHAHQWLDDGSRLGLVDFDGLALGDPELDAATFITEIDFENIERVPVAAINNNFLAGYEAVAGPLDKEMLRAYRSHKRLGKALRNAYALRSDTDQRVRQTLEKAIESIC